MAKKKKTRASLPLNESGEYDATSPAAPCIFCGSPGRYHIEYDCGRLGHRHPNVATCKPCTWLLSQLTGGQFTIQTKAFDGARELAQMKTDAISAVEQMLQSGRVDGDHRHDHLGKTPPRLDRDVWSE